MKKYLLVLVLAILLTACSSEASVQIIDRYWVHTTYVMYEDSYWVCDDYTDFSTCGWEDEDKVRCKVVNQGKELPAVAASVYDACWVDWDDWLEYKIDYVVVARHSESNKVDAWRMGNPAAMWPALEVGKVARLKVMFGEIEEVVSVK